ncbi:hypothetical protein MMC08_007685, partial [Hypocenomyce scalaris]|nr:hypothetical protein [Hypocenomyce scalaris]
MSLTTSHHITPLPLPRPLPSPPPHHIGTPPTSFRNPWPSFHSHSFLDAFLTSQRNRDFKPVPPRDKLVNVVTPDWATAQEGLKATWIGHASFLVETPRQEGRERGVRILFDPVFSERTSPVSWAGPKRYTPTPCTLAELPDVDVVVISHDHYDHLDSDTLRDIYARRKGMVHFLVPLGNAARLYGIGIAKEDVTQLDWWEGVQVEVSSVGSVKLTCTPSQHFSGRALWDRMSTLWSSWVLECGTSTEPNTAAPPRLFFAGDTGYRYVPQEASEDEVPFCPAFREIGEQYGPFDLSLLPIGLYSPRHFMSPVHCTPEDAVCLHSDLKSKRSIGMHWGTVRGGLSQYFEEVTEPPRRFREACEKGGKVWGKELGLLDVGETV